MGMEPATRRVLKDTMDLFWNDYGPTGLLIAVFVIAVTLIPIAIVARIILKLRGKKVKNGVRGQLTLVSASVPPDGASYSNYQIEGVLTAPGFPAIPVKKAGIAALSKWPRPGQVLPVQFEAANPQHFDVLWDEVTSAAQTSAPLAQQLAAQLNAGGAMAGGAMAGGGSPMTAGGFPQPGMVNLDLSPGAAPNAAVTAALMGNRVPGMATVTSVSESQPGAFAITVSVRSEAPGVSDFTTVMSMGFRPQSENRKRFLTAIGSQFPVLFDPSMPQLTMPDMARMPQGF